MEERLTPTSKELKRVKILEMVLAEQIATAKAAELLGVSERHCWRLLARYRLDGAAALVHGSRGRASSPRLTGSVRDEVLALAQGAYRDAGGAPTAMFLLFNPHNPIGRIFSEEELRAIGRICAENDTVLCSDDIHNALILGGASYKPAAPVLPEMAEQTITFLGPGKGVSVSGLGCAFAVIAGVERRQRFTQALWLRSLHPTSCVPATLAEAARARPGTAVSRCEQRR